MEVTYLSLSQNVIDIGDGPSPPTVCPLSLNTHIHLNMLIPSLSTLHETCYTGVIVLSLNSEEYSFLVHACFDPCTKSVLPITKFKVSESLLCPKDCFSTQMISIFLWFACRLVLDPLQHKARHLATWSLPLALIHASRVLQAIKTWTWERPAWK